MKNLTILFNYTMGAATDSWLAMMDRLLTIRDDRVKEKEEKEHLKENILKLIDIYQIIFTSM